MTKGSSTHRPTAARRFPFLHYIVVITVFFSANNPALAELLHGQVIRVSDGDTVVVEDAAGTRHKVRLLGIDAPESAQSFGLESGAWLRARVLAQPVRVEWHTHDRYQRLVGQVFIGTEDVGLSLLSHGLAWHYRAYAKGQTPLDRQAYSAAEEAARTAQRALWTDADPTPPWDWRREQRTQRHRQNRSDATPQTPLPQPHWTN